MSPFLHAFLAEAGCFYPHETLHGLIAMQIYTKDQLRDRWKLEWKIWVFTLSNKGIPWVDAKQIWMWFAKEKLREHL